MALQNKYQRVALDLITVDRATRQRTGTIDTSDLEPSIARRGVIQPIVVELVRNLADPAQDQLRLIAGERRYTASVRLGLKDIPVRFASDLSPRERELIELEENIKRSDLEWKDYCHAITRIHELHADAEGWTQARTAEEININTGVLSIILRVTEELRKKNPVVLAATNYRQAYNQVARREDRAVDDAMNDLMAEALIPIPTGDLSVLTGATPNGLAVERVRTGTTAEGQPIYAPGRTVIADAPVIQLPVVSAEERDILATNFHEWAASYSGLPFSFVHMDFPYGVDLGNSVQGNSAVWGGYADGEDVYWDLLATLAANRNRLFTTSAHFMFWFSMDYYTETLAFFTREMPDFVVQPFPLYWLKSDNKGILPDVKRGPRRIVETALIGSRGDRFIVKPVSNGYPAPTSKELHQSEKPEPMLRHFFQMFVDANTRMLDPTCGSATSLRAAESLGATVVQGLELNPEWAKDARIALRKFRTLRAIQEKK